MRQMPATLQRSSGAAGLTKTGSLRPPPWHAQTPSPPTCSAHSAAHMTPGSLSHSAVRRCLSTSWPAAGRGGGGGAVVEALPAAWHVAVGGSTRSMQSGAACKRAPAWGPESSCEAHAASRPPASAPVRCGSRRTKWCSAMTAFLRTASLAWLSRWTCGGGGRGNKGRRTLRRRKLRGCSRKLGAASAYCVHWPRGWRLPPPPFPGPPAPRPPSPAPRAAAHHQGVHGVDQVGPDELAHHCERGAHDHKVVAL